MQLSLNEKEIAMCTIGYHNDLGLIFKTRDKFSNTDEEIITNDKIIAGRTIGDDYYSWGLNQHGCAFVTAAINTPTWTRLIAADDLAGAGQQYKLENEGLQSPIRLVSKMLPDVKNVEMWIENVSSDPTLWMGYNVLVADHNGAYIVELYKDTHAIRKLDDSAVITNHFQVLDHGPKHLLDYPSSFNRLQLGQEHIAKSAMITDIADLLMSNKGDDDTRIWREGIFFTVSATMIEFNNGRIHYAKSDNGFFSRVGFDRQTQVPAPYQSLRQFEMSRYIDLDLYHQVEQSHPFYMEMTTEISAFLAQRCKPKQIYRMLELGAGTGLFTEALLRHPCLEVSALDIDTNCCHLLSQQFGEKIRVLHGDATTYCEEGGFDIVSSVFAHDHINHDLADAFARNIKNNLKKGGFYIMGGEYLADYDTDIERREAIYKYHCFIINKALREGNFRVAQIEINALESGIDMVGDFKRKESAFEAQMISAGLRLCFKKKIGPDVPDDVGGVFVYVYARDE